MTVSRRDFTRLLALSGSAALFPTLPATLEFGALPRTPQEPAQTRLVFVDGVQRVEVVPVPGGHGRSMPAPGPADAHAAVSGCRRPGCPRRACR